MLQNNDTNYNYDNGRIFVMQSHCADSAAEREVLGKTMVLSEQVLLNRNQQVPQHVCTYSIRTMRLSNYC